MSATENVRNRLVISSAVFVLGLALAVCLGSAQNQDAPQRIASSIAFERQFLRALYPDLNDKHYVLTISTAINYDDPASPLENFELNIGEGSTDLVIGYLGGYLGRKPPPGFTPGPIHPKQYLTARFGFREGQLQGFRAEGPVVEPQQVRDALFQAIASRPDLTNREANAALKNAGARFGVEDREAFLKSLPTKNLEAFLGKLTIASADLVGPNQNHEPSPFWPDWTVVASVRRPNGAEVKMEMRFEPFDGHLKELYVLGEWPPGNAPRF